MQEEIEFVGFGKITRDNPFFVTITEKINGTNGCIVIKDGSIVKVQSRRRFITPLDDNAGFAKWVYSNKEELETMGDGNHFGEWAGPKIQKNPLNLVEKTFFLFNTTRWNEDNQNIPKCCCVVPVLFTGELQPGSVSGWLDRLEDYASEGATPEGIVIYYHAFNTYTKHTIIHPNGKWEENGQFVHEGDKR